MKTLPPTISVILLDKKDIIFGAALELYVVMYSLHNSSCFSQHKCGLAVCVVWSLIDVENQLTGFATDCVSVGQECVLNCGGEI